jgi:hypothetical protein
MIYPNWDFDFEDKPSGNPGRCFCCAPSANTFFIFDLSDAHLSSNCWHLMQEQYVSEDNAAFQGQMCTTGLPDFFGVNREKCTK